MLWLSRFGGLILLGSLFLPWVGLAGVVSGDSLTLSAWKAFDLLRWVLLALALVIVALPRLRVAAAWVAVVLVASRLLDYPGSDYLELSWGGSVALAGALLAAVPRSWPRPVELVAGAGGLALVLSLSLSWYDPGVANWPLNVSDDEFLRYQTVRAGVAWEGLKVIDLVIAAAGVLALAVPFLHSRVAATVAAAAGAVAVVLVIVRIASPPVDFLEPATGIWFALAAAVVAVIGAALAARRSDEVA